jgi:hypothetical protein
VFVIDPVRCEQARRRPVNASGDRCAELNDGGGLKDRGRTEWWLSSTAELSPASERVRIPRPRSLPAKKKREVAPGSVDEGLADVQHASRANRFEKMGRFVFIR